MKRRAAILLIGLAITTLVSSAMVSAGGLDREQCRGGFNTSLVTETECEAYLNEHRGLEMRNDREGLRNLEAPFAITSSGSAPRPCSLRRPEDTRVCAATRRVLSPIRLYIPNSSTVSRVGGAWQGQRFFGRRKRSCAAPEFPAVHGVEIQHTSGGRVFDVQGNSAPEEGAPATFHPILQNGEALTQHIPRSARAPKLTNSTTPSGAKLQGLPVQAGTCTPPELRDGARMIPPRKRNDLNRKRPGFEAVRLV